MRLVVLGSGVCQPALRRSASAYAVEAGGDLLLFDLGSGALRNAMAAGLDPRDARHVFLSHFHPDHTADLVPFLFACNYAPGWTPAETVHLYGPEGVDRFLDDLQVPWRWLEPRGWSRQVHPLPGGGRATGDGWAVTAFPVDHGGPAVAWRVEGGGRVLCYSGDTGPCEGLVRAARGADLLLVECSVPEGFPPVPGHMASADVGRLATEAGAARVLLTHLYPEADAVDVVAQVARHFRGPVEKAADGASYPV